METSPRSEDDVDFYGDGESSPTESSTALIGGQGHDLAGLEADNIGKFSALC